MKVGSVRWARVFGRLLALNLVLFSAPLLPGWLAVAAEDSEARLVVLCTGKGLRLVAVTADEAPGRADTGGQVSSAFECAACPLGKCANAGSSLTPATALVIDADLVGVDAVRAASDPAPTTHPLERGPPTRAPPVIV